MIGRWTLLSMCLIAVGGGTALACLAPEPATTTPETTELLDLPSCLQRSSGNIYVPNVTNGTGNRIGIPAGKTADLRGKSLVANSPLYPLNVNVNGGMGAGSCITGLKVTGRQSTNLSWNEMKSNYDGDGVRIDLTGSPGIVERSYFYNTEDGVAPRSMISGGSNNHRWIVRNTYMRHIADDAIENDQCLGGAVEDILVDGTYVAFSARVSGKNPCPSGYQNRPMVVRNAYIRLQCTPNNRAGASQTSGCPSGYGTGQIFKWWGSSPQPVDVRDSIFVQPALQINGVGPTCYFPPGNYRNVVIVWTGTGSWPCTRMPAGVTVTRDIGIWNQAKATWLQRHGCTSNGSSCSFTER